MAYSSAVEARFSKATDAKLQEKKLWNKDDADIGIGLVGAPACGDVMKVMIKVDEKGNIIDTDFKIFGCGAAVASASLAAEKMKNKTLKEASAITNEEISAELELPPVKRHCSLLAEEGIKAAINDYMKKQSEAKNN